MTPIRVLLITSALGPPTRGNGVTVARWRGWAEAAGLVLHAAHPDGDIPNDAFDLVHGYHAVHGGERARAIAEARGLPLVVSLGGSDLYALGGGAIVATDWRERTAAVLRAATLTTGAFPAFGRAAAEALGEPLPYAWVPRGVQLPPERVRTARAPEAPLRVLMPAGLRPIKAPLLALRLVRHLHEAGLSITLDLLGPPLDDETARQVTREAAALPFVRLGLAPLDDMPQHYDAADVVWNTSLHEGGANALLEAAAHGCAVYARDVPGNRELLANPVFGTLFDAEGENWMEHALAFHKELHRALAEEPPTRVLERRSAARAWLSTHHAERAEIFALRAAYERALEKQA